MRSGLMYWWYILPVGMWFTSSTAPISTTLSPVSGSNPVVSVSSRISRIADLSPDLAKDILNALPRLFKGLRGDHVLRPRALCGVRRLPCEDGSETVFGHSRSCKDTRALGLRRRRRHHRRIHTRVPARLEEQRN